MLATGARIGEVLALRWGDVDLDAVRLHLTITGTVETEPGTGTCRSPAPNRDASVTTVALSAFAVAVLRRRDMESRTDALDAVFATRGRHLAPGQ